MSTFLLNSSNVHTMYDRESSVYYTPLLYSLDFSSDIRRRGTFIYQNGTKYDAYKYKTKENGK